MVDGDAGRGEFKGGAGRLGRLGMPPFSTSSAVTRMVSGVSFMRSNFSVNSSTASSPRARTSAMTSATMTSTSGLSSRLAFKQHGKGSFKVSSLGIKKLGHQVSPID